MATLSQASREWASRPSDERFLDLPSMESHFQGVRDASKALVVSSRKLHAEPADGDAIKGLVVTGPNGHPVTPTNWSFGQLAMLSGAPAGYLRSLPSPIAADCINYGLQYKRDVEDVGVLLQKTDTPDVPSVLRAVTGPRYGRVWNLDVIRAIISRFGDGRTGDFRVPGEFGVDVDVTKTNTTLYASDRDCFVFLADERNRIEVPNRRDGKPGLLARGFFIWNSEVGSTTLGISTFLFDYACSNRTVWGAQDINELRIRHTVSAPDRFIDEVAPALESYSNSSTRSITEAIENARSKRLNGDDLDKFLTERFSKSMASQLKAIHELEEGRPIENLWDVNTAVTAKARSIPYQDERVALEREGGRILKLAA